MAVGGRKPSFEVAAAAPVARQQTGIIDGISPPADLSPVAKDIWGVMLTELTELGVFRPADAILLAEFCEMLAEAQRLRRAMQIPKTTSWIYSERGFDLEEKRELAADPDAVAELWPISQTYKRARTGYQQTMTLIHKFLSEYGMSPVSRLRLGLLQLQGQNLADLFADDDAPPLQGEVIDALEA